MSLYVSRQWLNAHRLLKKFMLGTEGGWGVCERFRQARRAMYKALFTKIARQTPL